MRRLVCAMIVASCGHREVAESPPDKGARLAGAIARDLTARLGTPAAVHCRTLFGFPRGCVATLPDHSTLRIRVRETPKQWTWQVEELVVDARPIESYVGGVLEDLGAAQAVDCGARTRHVVAGARVECGLARGGKAFVTIGADGAMALELALDGATARARSEDAPDLERASRALEHTEDEEDDEGATTDAGVESAP